jgi:hypothetical protein
MQINDKYKFSSDSADAYQTVRGWHLTDLDRMLKAWSYFSMTKKMKKILPIGTTVWPKLE